MSEIKLSINGLSCIGSTGETILQIAERYGIHIPTLCHKEEVRHYGACGLCVVEAEGSAKLLRACSTLATDGMAIQTEGHDSLLFDADLPYHPLGLREAERLARQGIRVEAFQNCGDTNFIKFVTYDTPGCDRERFLRETSALFDSVIRANTMVEYVKKGHSKAEGMERFLSQLHVPKDEIFAIGDSENDLPMFAMAGHTICLGDGVESVKQQAEYVTDPVLGDGVFNALRHFGLI